MLLTDALDILTEVNNAIAPAPGEIGNKIKEKFESVLQNNPGIFQLIQVAKVLTGEKGTIEMDPDKMAALKFAPITSCDVERSFSIYKTILSEKRTNFSPENLEMYLICNCEKRD